MTTKSNSNPAFLRVALWPYHRGGPERHVVISTRMIQRVSPPSQLRKINSAGVMIRATVPDPRYCVAFKENRVLECGHATRDELDAAGIPVPTGYS